MKLIFLFLLVSILSGCGALPVKVHDEQLLNGGKIWRLRIGYAQEFKCKRFKYKSFSDWLSDNSTRKNRTKAMNKRVSQCVDKKIPDFFKAGEELCGKKPSRIFFCKATDPSKHDEYYSKETIGFPTPKYYISCLIECSK